MTEHIINRIKLAGVFDHVVLAIPDLPTESPLEDIAHRLKVDCVKGPEEDVLKRFILAADSVQADHVLRVCGDNPLIDIPLMKELHKAHLHESADYTIVKDEIPLGSGTEMVCVEALKKISTTTREKHYLEHVTPYIYDHPDQFKIHHIPAPYYLRNIPIRMTVDTQADLAMVQRLYDQFSDPYLPVSLEDAIIYLAKHPEISALNSHIVQKDWRN